MDRIFFRSDALVVTQQSMKALKDDIYMYIRYLYILLTSDTCVQLLEHVQSVMSA